MQPYNEKLRDSTSVNTAPAEGMSDEKLSEVLLETLRQFFMSSSNFTTSALRGRSPAYLWSSDDAASTVRIVRDGDWAPGDMGRTPTIVIKSGGTQWQATNVSGMIDAPWVAIEDPTFVSELIICRYSIWVISPVFEEAWNIAWELGTFFSAFSRALSDEWGLAAIRPAGISNPVHIKEAKEYWGATVALAVSWQITQAVAEQQPLLAELHVRTNNT